MTTKRRILQALSIRELQYIAAQNQLAVTDRRSISANVDAIVRAASVPLAKHLSDLTRTRLKEICRSVGINDAGTKKMELVTRLLHFGGIVEVESENVDRALDRLILLGKKRGYVTYNDVNQSMPGSLTSQDDIDEWLRRLSDNGIDVVESVAQAQVSNLVLNGALLRLLRRAEAMDRSKLVATFVDTGALATLLMSKDHQVVYGRRGTGKTHALLYVADTASTQGDVAAYVDLRTIGSTGGLYSDPLLPISERATRLLMDTISSVHGELTRLAIERDDLDLASLGPGLDALASASSQIQVKADDGAQGAHHHRVHFGALGTAFKRVRDALGRKRLWILLDEWSTLPLELQPYLADLIRRAFLPVPSTTTKIAAIEHRTSFKVATPFPGEYIGIELGADVAADVNLDDFMVFDNSSERATAFFKDLLFRHYKSVEQDAGITSGPVTPEQFVSLAFTQKTPFDDLVVAAEGVPRDAINILALSAQQASQSPISIPHVRSAARTWFQRDKEAAASANPAARSMLNWIVDNVIGHRRARAFLLRSGVRDPLVDALFDARVLHLLKRGIAAHDQPGVRYDVFKIDYGCYVDLLATQKAPKGLLPKDTSRVSEDSYVDVPPDDYRAIRRAILDVSEFARAGEP